MTPFPSYRPKTLSLGPLETEILEIIWLQGPTSATAIHQTILEDIDRELTYSSVSTVLKRLMKKGCVSCDSANRVHICHPLFSEHESKVLNAHDQLHQFLAVGSPDIVAAFAEELDNDSLTQLDDIVEKVKAARQARGLS